MNIKQLSETYDVRKIADSDIEAVYKLCRENTTYYSYCPPMITINGIQKDMAALPPGKAMEDKYYIGFWKGSGLAAVMDLIDGYPDEHTAYIGFFMMDKHLQSKGIGTGIFREVQKSLTLWGVKNIELAYVKGNRQSEAFWKKNYFIPKGKEVDQGKYIVIPVKKELY